MNAEIIESTAQFSKLQTQLRRRVVNRKLETTPLMVTCIGGCYRARMEGSNVAAFGTDPSEARQRVTKLEGMRSFCTMKQCDVHEDFYERFGYYHHKDPRAKRGQV